MIIVNGRFMTQPMTGVQRYSANIVRELGKLRDDLRFAVPANSTLLPEFDDLPTVAVGRLTGHLWEQVDLPAYLRTVGRPLLLNLAGTAPVTYSNQIVTHHDITYIRHPESFSRAFNLAYRALVPLFLRNSKKIITVSQFSLGEISSHFRIPTSKFVVASPAADAQFSPATSVSPGDPYFLAVSSPNKHKNFARLIEAFEQVAGQTQTKLKIVGSQSNNFAQSKLSGETASRVEFLGRIDDVTLRGVYRGARAFVFPSLYEGFGIPPLEAQRSGVPVLSARAASMPEVLGESAYYFDPTDVNAITAALQRIDTDAALRDDLIARGRENQSRYTFEASAATVAALISDIEAVK